MCIRDRHATQAIAFGWKPGLTWSVCLVLLIGDDDDFVLAELRDQEIFVRVQLRSGVFETRLNPPPTSMPLNADQRRFNDDRWHSLVISREAREVQLTLLSVSPFTVYPYSSPALFVCYLFDRSSMKLRCLLGSLSDSCVS